MIAIALSAGLAGCGGGPRSAPPAAAAPVFADADERQLQSTMWQLAAGIRELERVFEDGSGVSLDQRDEVLRILDRMIAAAGRLEPADFDAAHRHVVPDLERFRHKLAIARRAVSFEPPRYYLVGSLSGTCLACHGGPSERSAP